MEKEYVDLMVLAVAVCMWQQSDINENKNQLYKRFKVISVTDAEGPTCVKIAYFRRFSRYSYLLTAYLRPSFEQKSSKQGTLVA